MADKRVVLWILTALYAVNAQNPGQAIYHLRSDGVYKGSTRIFLRDLSAADANICFTGDTLFLADTQFSGGVPSTTILSFPTETDGVATDVKTLAAGAVSLACCCRYLAYGYHSGDDDLYYVILNALDTPEQRLEYSFPPGNSRVAAIDIDCSTDKLTAVTDGAVYHFSFESAVPVAAVPLSETLPSGPRCLAPFDYGSENFIAVSFEDRPSYHMIELVKSADSNYPTVSHRVFREGQSQELKISCLDTDENEIHFFARSTSQRMGYLFSATPSDMAATTSLTVNPDGFGLATLGEFVNGLEVCTNCSDTPCLFNNTNTCEECDRDPGFAVCGFCSPTGMTCVCTNPETSGCVYDDPALSEGCAARPTPKLDALCAVLNPVAPRNTGGPNGVAAIISPGQAAEVESAVIGRRVKTGRWPIDANPRWNEIAATGEVLEGFETEVQANARGRRFGFFQARFTRTDTTDEDIFCITTESSAFVNQVFTYVAVEGSPITLEVDLGNQFLSEVRWLRTSLVTGDTVPLPESSASLTHYIPFPRKSTDEGVYEAFRAGRYLRTWHPIIDLHVRECDFNKFGLGNALDPTPCTGNCPACVHGTCDVVTGNCRCYPGYTGELCDELCASPNLVGQNCDIDCDLMYPGAAGNDCVKLLLCLHEGMGCHCAPGLQPPACAEACPPGTYGPDCLGDCNGCPDCNPRSGCPPDP